MRNFKKFLSLVLAALMVTGMMVFTAPAASAAEYEATGDYADSITLLNTLEVMLGDGESFNEKGKVTRWQMALFIARIVTGEVGNEMWEADKSQIFTDVAANHYPGAIDFCAELGIINGIGDGKFNPDGNITYQDALTMFVRLLGYEKSTTTYPWGYILTAVKLETANGLLTDGIDTKYTADLLREEVAQLLVNALYAYQAKTDGTQGTSTLMITGLKAVELGTYTLVANDFASITGTVAAAGKVTFAAEGKDNVTISASNVTKGDLEIVNYLGATAKLISIKGKTYATMDSFKVIDNYGAKTFAIDGAKIKVDKTSYNTVVYGESLTELFVAAEAEDLNLYGRVYIFDINGDGKAANDIARFVPFTEAKALYPISVKVEKKNSWPADGNVTLYYVPEAGKYNVPVNAAGMFMYPQVGKVDGNQPGLNLGKTMSNSKTDKNARTALAGWGWRESTSLRVITDGEVVFGNVFVGGYTKIGEYTFLTVGETLEVVTGTAKLAGIGEDSVKLGETEFKVGYADLGEAVNGWLLNFAELGADAVALLNKDVDYTTVNGKVVAIAKKGTTPTTTVASDPLTKDALLLAIAKDGKNVSVNEDGTLNVAVYDNDYEARVTVKIDQINGTKLGSLINQFGLNTAATIIGASSADLDAMILHLVSANANPYVTSATAGKENMVLVAVANKTDDVYSVSTTAKDLAAIKQVVFKAATTLEFTNYKTSALSSKYSLGTWKDGKYNYADKYLTLNAESKVIVIGSDAKLTFTGFVPADKDTLVVSADAVVIKLASDKVVVFDATKTVAEIANFTTASTPAVEFKGGYYTLTWKSDYVGIDVTTENNVPVFHYTFTGMYDLATRKENATVVLSSKTYYTEPETAFFGDHWKAGEAPTSADADNLNLYDIWYITNDVAAEAECVVASNLIEWAVANKYQIGRLAKGSIVAGDKNTLIIDAYTINEDGKSATNKNDDAENARNVSVVVDFSGLYFNQSANSVKDEINIFDCKIHDRTGNSGYIKKATETNKEWVAYKITDEGIADIIVNCADNLK